MNYRKGYTLLFNRITDALEQLAQQNAPAAAKILKLAQQEAEELYLAGEPEHDFAQYRRIAMALETNMDYLAGLTDESQPYTRKK